jgi:hypothetical protein
MDNDNNNNAVSRSPAMICSTAHNDETPFERGYQVGLTGNGIAPRRFPTPDDDWATRLYFRGWEKGNSERGK